MRDARQPLHPQIPHVALRALQADQVERHVLLAPDHHGWHVDRRVQPGHTRRLPHGAIPVQHRRRGAGLGDLPRIDVHDLGRDRQAAEHPPHRRAAIGRQHPLRQHRHLEEADIPGPPPLPPMLQRRPEAQRVRHVHDHQPLQRPDLPGGEAPGDHRPPIMRDQRHRPGARGVDQPRHIRQQVRQRIRPDPHRPAALAIAALVHRPDTVAEPGQHRHLVAPRDEMLRKAVQAQRQVVAGPGLLDLERQPVGFHRLQHRAAPHIEGRKALPCTRIGDSRPLRPCYTAVAGGGSPTSPRAKSIASNGLRSPACSPTPTACTGNP